MTIQTHQHFATLGYLRLVPIVPPDAEISPSSSLHRGIGVPGKDPRGKVPGIRRRDGLWSGLDWLATDGDALDFDRWSGMGAGVGIKTGEQPDETWLVVSDADTRNHALADIIRGITEVCFGDVPTRIGQAPKAAYVLRLAGAVPYSRIEFGAGDAVERVEFLSDGRQFVASGVHPGTRQPYHWPIELPPYDDLPIISLADFAAYQERLRAALPEAKPLITEGAKAAPPQETLRGRLDLVRKAVAVIPNTSKLFPSRESFLKVGYAVKAALPEDQFEALAIYQEWCGRWTDGDNDPEIVEAEWRRMRPPYRVGAAWLFDLAQQHSGGTFSAASEMWFDATAAAQAEQANVLQVQAAATALREIDATPFVLRDPSSLPRRRWLYGYHLIRGFVSLTTAPGGIGKSSLVQAEAVAMATGKPLLGVQPAEGALRVWVWNGEDPHEELERRITAICMQYQIDQAEIAGQLFLDSGLDMPIIIAQTERSGTVIARPVIQSIVDTIRRNRIDVLVVDPFISSHNVSENDNGAIDAVAKSFGRIANATGCAIELVHHVRKGHGDEIAVEDGRGAGALLAAARSARVLNPMTQEQAAYAGVEHHRRYFRVDNGKANLAPPPDRSDWFKIQGVSLGNGEGDAKSDDVAVIVPWRWPAAVVGVAPDALQRVREAVSGGHYREDPQSADWVGKVVAGVLGLDHEDRSAKARVKMLIKDWLTTGFLRSVEAKDNKGAKRKFVEVGTIASA